MTVTCANGRVADVMLGRRILSFHEDWCVLRGERNELVPFLWLCLFSRMHFWWQVQDFGEVFDFASVQNRGRDGDLWGMAVSSLFYCCVHYIGIVFFGLCFCIGCIVFWCVLGFTICSRCVNFVARPTLLERFLSLDLNVKLSFSGVIAVLLGQCFDRLHRTGWANSHCVLRLRVAPRSGMDVSWFCGYSGSP